MKTLAKDKLTDLAAALSAQGWRVIAPVEDEGVVRLKEWTPGLAIRTDVVPVNSLKDFFLPRSEVIGRSALEGDGFRVLELEPEAVKTAVLGARPCDAAALAVLDAVFNWDYKDEFYNARRAAATVVSLACAAADARCFCTSVGGRPDSKTGADAILRPADQGRRLSLEPVSDKGKGLCAAVGGLLQEAESILDPAPEVARRFDSAAVTEALARSFESPLWREISLPCLGCGACAFACPACHCFDIQDEASRRETVRLRNWDSCGFGLFTLHAGGHNPRPDQAARWRQRVLHKFSYFPQRFKMLACTGCGRCGRICPAGMDISAAVARAVPARETVS